MRLVMTLLCRDEADIIASTVRFHLDHGVDHLIVTDNGSTDGTIEILQRFQASGRVTLLQENRHDHDQSVWVTRMARLAATDLSADWLIHGDADEFWWPACGSLKLALESVPPEWDVINVSRINYLPPPPDLEGLSCHPFYRRQLIRERESLNADGVPLPSKVCHRADPAAKVHDGNHRVSIGGKPLNSIAWEGLEILHFPVRSYAQFERKIRQGAEALERNRRIRATTGRTWRHIYKTYWQQGRLDDYYRELQLDEQQREAGLLRGELIVDDRLRRALDDGN